MITKNVTCPCCGASVNIQVDANYKIHQNVVAVCPKCNGRIPLEVTVVIAHVKESDKP